MTHITPKKREEMPEMEPMFRMVEASMGFVRQHILIVCLLSAVSFVLFGYLLAAEVDFEHIGLLAIMYVVGLGISLTAVVYHGLRYRQSYGLAAFDRQTIQSHIDVTHEMEHGI